MDVLFYIFIYISLLTTLLIYLTIISPYLLFLRSFHYHGRMWDVVVVGAGPSGSTTAYLLAKTGFKALIVELSKFPRHKPCGGGITLKAGRLLKELGLPLEPVEEIHRDVTIMGYGKEITVSTPPGEYAIALVRREFFDNRLLESAIGEGARFRISKVRAIKILEDRVRLVGPDVEAGYVIGADGANSTVALSARVRGSWSKEDIILAIEGIAPPQDRLTFMVDAAPHGYGWIFPRGRDSSAGVGGMVEKSKEIMDAFRIFSSKFGVRFNGSWIIPAGGHDKPIARDRVILVGDAAGLADPLTGEGLYYALSSALEASRSMESDSPAREYVARMRYTIEELKAKRKAARIIIPRMRFFFDLFVSYPEIARRYMLSSIGREEFRDFWRWAVARVPRALIKSKLGI